MNLVSRIMSVKLRGDKKRACSRPQLRLPYSGSSKIGSITRNRTSDRRFIPCFGEQVIPGKPACPPAFLNSVIGVSAGEIISAKKSLQPTCTVAEDYIFFYFILHIEGRKQIYLKKCTDTSLPWSFFIWTSELMISNVK